MATENLKIRVTSDSTQAKRDLGGFDDKMKSTIKSVASLAVAMIAVKKSFDFFAQSTKMAMEQEAIFRKLQSSVEITGKAWGSASGELDKLFASLQRTTKYGDTESAEVFQRIITLTGDYDKALTGLPIALDLAASGLFNAETAARYVGMAMTGNIEMLGRYIAEFKATTNEQLKNMDASEKVAYAVDVLREKFGGLAEKELQTTSGQLKQLNNYWGDFREAIGDKVLPMISAVQEDLMGLAEILGLWDKPKIEVDFGSVIGDLEKAGTSQEELNNLRKQQLMLLERELKAHYEVSGRLVSEKDIENERIALAEFLENAQGRVLSLRAQQLVVSDKEKEAIQEKIDSEQDYIAGLRESLQGNDENLSKLKEIEILLNTIKGIGIDLGNEETAEQIEEIKEMTAELIETTRKYHKVVVDVENAWESVNEKLHKQLEEELMYLGLWGSEASNIFYEAFGGAFDNIEDYFKNMLKRMAADLLASGLISLFGGAGVGLFSKGGLFGFLGLHTGGEISNVGGKPVRGASGLDFTVPQGFPNDSFPILVESGEHVSVTPAGGGSRTDELLEVLINELKNKPVANTVVFDDVNMSRYVDRGALKREVG